MNFDYRQPNKKNEKPFRSQIIDSQLCINASMLKELAQNAVLSIFFRMKLIYFVFTKCEGIFLDI